MSDVVAAHRFHRQTPAEIAVGYELPLEKAAAALAYYAEHQAEVDADMQAQDELFERSRAEWRARGGKPLFPEGYRAKDGER